ncbi:galactose mutarotase-like [Cataglyphis hispanica]|uniref:galactose mutarotase-like n=1 Tax=Cataglyphis hispanica TaxID=1086592 RepID=UPI002180883C|nr:galactose mutarotase-like [Cataglyphis hispanica]
MTCVTGYTNPRINPFIGCVLGRCANRIRNGCIVIKGKIYQLTRNDLNKHHLHGGEKGFGRRLWDSYIDGCSVVMTYLSEDGEEGYPGTVLSTVRFKLTPDNRLEIGIRATTTDSTIVNISHGSLFNLAGHDAGKKELLKHKISLNCDRWTFADYTDPIPTGSIRGVGGTIMDLRIPKFLESCIEKVPPGEGYDHNFCVTPNWHGGSTHVARVVHPESGRVLEVYSDQPGVQFYTGGRLSTNIVSETGNNITVKQDDNREDEEDKEDEEEEGEDEGENEGEDEGKDEGEDEREDEGEDKGENEEDEGENEGEDEGENEGEDEGETLMANRMEQDAISEPTFLLGKKGARYEKHCAFSIQPQNYPNAINYVS